MQFVGNLVDLLVQMKHRDLYGIQLFNAKHVKTVGPLLCGNWKYIIFKKGVMVVEITLEILSCYANCVMINIMRKRFIYTLLHKLHRTLKRKREHHSFSYLVCATPAKKN